jgi:7-cyano-7-deazaguanine synthase
MVALPQKVHAVVAFSGGMDSATLLALAHHNAEKKGEVVRAFGFHYGSKHNQYELAAATRFTQNLGVQYDILDLNNISAFLSSNLLKTGGDIPEGHYAQDTMTLTVVPGRNTIFSAILLGIAQSIGAGYALIGAHSGDHAIYPDCREDWLAGMMAAAFYASEGKVCLTAPFLHMDKTSILNLSYKGMEFTGDDKDLEPVEPLGVDYSLTRTCYKDQPISCGRCGSCQERLEAFRNIGIEDPLEYETREILPKV